VQYVFPGSPAEAAGLLPGDEILAIDGESSSGLTAVDAVRRVRGEANTTVKLTVARPGLPGTKDYDVVRASIHIPQLEARRIDDVAYLLIRGFPTSSLYDEVSSQIQSFAAAGASGMVLDLRGNSGGRLDVGTKIAGLFLPEGSPLYQEKTRRGREDTQVTTSTQIWARPLAVLIDDGTASMGEILAAALQEDLKVPLFGTQTAGAVAGSVIVPLRDGSALQITTLRIDSPNGRILNGIGVAPDVVFPMQAGLAGSGPDAALDAALTYVRTTAAQQNSGPKIATPPGGLAPTGVH
jgi:carboxyl-terminal processing protease